MKTRVLLVVCVTAIALVVLAGDPGLAPVAVWVGACATLFAVIVSVVVRLLGGGDRSQTILQERLARGEITTAEFAEARRILGR